MVYDVLDGQVAVLTILHLVRDIERIITAMGPRLLDEINALRNRKTTREQ